MLRQVAAQEGELESEVKGLREAPSGYGVRAREEDYHLTVLKKTTEVDLQLVEEALATKQKADALLNQADSPSNIQQVMDLQDKLRAAAKDVGGVAGVARAEVLATWRGAQVADLPFDRLPAAAEVFLTSAVRGILPVCSIGALRFAPGIGSWPPLPPRIRICSTSRLAV